MSPKSFFFLLFFSHFLMGEDKTRARAEDAGENFIFKLHVACFGSFFLICLKEETFSGGLPLTLFCVKAEFSLKIFSFFWVITLSLIYGASNVKEGLYSFSATKNLYLCVHKISRLKIKRWEMRAIPFIRTYI